VTSPPCAAALLCPSLCEIEGRHTWVAPFYLCDTPLLRCIFSGKPASKPTYFGVSRTYVLAVSCVHGLHNICGLMAVEACFVVLPMRLFGSASDSFSIAVVQTSWCVRSALLWRVASADTHYIASTLVMSMLRLLHCVLPTTSSATLLHCRSVEPRGPGLCELLASCNLGAPAVLLYAANAFAAPLLL
jgi:hypothetical protein